MRTVVYGITASTEMLFNSPFSPRNYILACTSGGEDYKGQKALSLNELRTINKDDIEKVIICSEFVFDIFQSLISIGMESKKLFFFNHMSSTLVSCESMLTPAIKSNNVLFAFYDLAYNLPCYDVITFMILAEQERKKQNKDFIQFVIVPNHDDEHQGINVYHDNSDTKWRIEKVIKASFMCLPSCLSIDQPANRAQLSYYQTIATSIYPDRYFKEQRQPACDFRVLKDYKTRKIDISSLVPPKQALEIVDSFLECIGTKKKVITITLREYWANSAHRNSDLLSWLEFAKSLDSDEYLPVIIRDTTKAAVQLPSPFGSLVTFPIAAIDFTIRLALYHRAHINMGVDNGPMYPISYLKGARSIIFRWVTNDIPNLSERTNERHFFKVGQNHFFNDNEFQINAWMKDSFENITNQFYELENKIKNKP